MKLLQRSDGKMKSSVIKEEIDYGVFSYTKGFWSGSAVLY